MGSNTPTSSFRDYIMYEEELITGVCAVLLGLGVKTLMKKEFFPVSNGRKIVETFIAVVAASVAGHELTVKLKKDGYLR